MIEIKNVTKSFKNKGGKTVAINNTSLTLESKGLVALLGPSGCGKTTMLNCIGGLDKVNEGNIFINGEKISKRTAHNIDKIRNKNIGYIFQDYKLVDSLSVFENIAIVLKMLGVKNKTEIRERVEYVLGKVDMLRYKKRPCSMLSGGERQRVAIARALVKNPQIILADEPTGNLDSKNSLEVMKIISAIAKERLVVLVTHEVPIANFYANRIIKIKDGTVESDNINNASEGLDYKIESSIYLKDFERVQKLKDDGYNINIYSNLEDVVDFEIVVKGGNLYIKSKSRVEVVDSNSNIEFIDDNYRQMERDDLNGSDFNMQPFEGGKQKYSSIFSFSSLISTSFKKVAEYPILKKLLLLGIFASAVFITFSFSIFAKLNVVDEGDYLKYHKDYVIIESKGMTLDAYTTIKSLEGVNYAIPIDAAAIINLHSNNWYQTTTSPIMLSGSLTFSDNITENDVIYGEMIQKKDEVVLDKMIIDKMLTTEESKQIGLLNVEDFIGTSLLNKYKVVGVVDTGNPSIYAPKETVMKVIEDIYFDGASPVLNYENVENLELYSGSLPTNHSEVIINSNSRYEYGYGDIIEEGNQKLEVVGYYESNSMNEYIVNETTLEEYMMGLSSRISINSSDTDLVISQLENMGIKGEDSYEVSKREYQSSIKEINTVLFIIGLIVGIVSLLIIYLISRASFLSRIKEVGIYRSIGVKKFDIYKMFLGEIIAIFTLASMPGIIISFYILRSVSLLEPFVLANVPVFIATIVMILGFMLVVGLIPVFNTIRKPPAYILARTDI